MTKVFERLYAHTEARGWLFVANVPPTPSSNPVTKQIASSVAGRVMRSARHSGKRPDPNHRVAAVAGAAGPHSAEVLEPSDRVVLNKGRMVAARAPPLGLRHYAGRPGR